jgi:transposase InsO family protein
VISWDLIGPLPESQTFNTIVMIIDTWTKGIKLKPVNITISAMGAAIVMQDHVYQEEGLPSKVYSDRGPQFISKFMKELYKLLGIKGNPSTAYHPQTNSQTEQINCEMEKYLRMCTNNQQTDWADWLPLTEFTTTTNNVVQEATGQTPFYLNKDHHP